MNTPKMSDGRTVLHDPTPSQSESRNSYYIHAGQSVAVKTENDRERAPVSDGPTSVLQPRPGVSAPSDVLATLGYSRPNWQLDALCKEYPNLPWHPERGQSVDPALQVCGRYAVREPCLEWAMADASLLGVLGGTSAKVRRNRRKLDAKRPT